MKQISSIDVPVGEDSEMTLGDLAADETDVEGSILDEVQQEQHSSVLWPLVDALPGERGCVLRMLYQEELTRQQAGDRLNCSAERIRQYQSDALRQLRREKHARHLRPFLPEAQEAAAYRGSGVDSFNRTWTSSTERVALDLYDNKEMLRKYAEVLKRMRKPAELTNI